MDALPRTDSNFSTINLINTYFVPLLPRVSTLSLRLPPLRLIECISREQKWSSSRILNGFDVGIRI